MYCILQDIIDDVTERTLIELTNDDDGGLDVNEDLVNAKIDEVCRYIDSNLSVSYTVPITNLDDIKIIRPIAITLVICDLFQRRLSLNYPPSLIQRKKDAMNDLMNIQKGLIQLNPVNSPSKESCIRVSSRTQIFTDKVLNKY